MDWGTALFPAYSRADIARGIREAMGEIMALLAGTVTTHPRGALDRELRETIAPHLAILIHKRRRYLAVGGTGAAQGERWAKELDDFIGRTLFWPMPAATEAFRARDRADIARILDRMIAEEQTRAEAARDVLPSTSRFDSSWTD